MSTLYANADLDALQADADNSLLNFGTAFNTEIITHAKDVFIYTADGRRILDWTSGQMSCLIGHGHPEVVQTITEHATNLDHLFTAMISPPVINLAMKLTSLLPEGLDKAMFLSTGGESNEAAIKLAKVFTGKWEIVGLASSWHGMTSGALAAQYHSGRKGHGPLIPGNYILPVPNAYRSVFRKSDGSHDWETELNYGWEMVDRASNGSLAAVIMEPILSSGGMITLPPGYLKAMKVQCERRGMLLILDEAQTGIGRCGNMFAFEHEGVVPDILTLSKTLGNGLPLSAVVTSNSIASASKESGFLFLTTHTNDPLPAAVGLKVLEIVVRDNLVARSRESGAKLHVELQKLMSRYGCIGDVRGRGLMAGVEIVEDRDSKTPGLELGRRLAAKMSDLGLSANIATIESFGGMFRIAPPITISDENLYMGLNIMEEAFRSTEGSLPLYD
ncbi:Uncharacterized protein BP5553_09943 [Venustampulla echinocandica]|uniref:2,2-dialkylglycine decarboxylase n=1 Tax=Venustampulla echinocandica TaxID=2656787 RepID=A0A370TB53_9HELO|nr:Uncharacterized protein BP5553_09943 [Venustampulla echinocandica]RDL31154.1 Uncharacterized protein BP5553_09943 [Venustampulla echinocandica]